MRYFRNTYVLFAAALVFALLSMSLHHLSAGIDIALCATFTIVVFGNAVRKSGRSLLSGEEAKTLSEILLAHAICLGTLVMIVRAGMFSLSSLPDWLNIPVAADKYGRIGPSTFQILQALAIYFLGYLEFRMLTAKKEVNPEKEEKRAQASLWRKAEVEAQRMDGLRF
jgi:hypothetical protein